MILDRLTLEQKVNVLLMSALPDDDRVGLLLSFLPEEVKVLRDSPEGGYVMLAYKGSQYAQQKYPIKPFNVMQVLRWIEAVDSEERKLKSLEVDAPALGGL